MQARLQAESPQQVCLGSKTFLFLFFFSLWRRVAQSSSSTWRAIAIFMESFATDLASAVLRADDSAARTVWHCSNAEYSNRSTSASAGLRDVLNGTAADSVTSVVIPASGADIRTALSAFPRAHLHVLLSAESAYPAVPRTLPSLINNQTAIASLSAIFACSHGGGYFIGIQLKKFAQEWGLLPVLLFALSQVAHLTITGVIARTGASLPGATITACRGGGSATGVAGAGAGASGRCEHPLRIRYVQAALGDTRTIPTLVSDVHAFVEHHSMIHTRPRAGAAASSPRGSLGGSASAPARVRRALLIKSAEVAFRGGGADDAARNAAQVMLSIALLRGADVLLQDTQSSIPWETLWPWRERHNARLMPLGAYVGPEDALYDHNNSKGGGIEAGAASLRAELRQMRSLWRHSPLWRSLKGQRFGYCHGEHALSAELLAARIPLSEPPALGESDANERGQPLYCAALLAWRSEPGTPPVGYWTKLEE